MSQLFSTKTANQTGTFCNFAALPADFTHKLPSTPAKATTMKKFALKYLYLISVAFLPLLATAQSSDFSTQTNITSGWQTYWKSHGRFDRPFKQLDLSVMASSTGFGLELSYPLHRNIGARLGFTYMPQINKTLTFDVEGDGEAFSFSSLSETYHKFFGIEVDNKVEMEGVVKFYNFNLLFDIYPFKNKNWYLTAGAYFGAKEIGHAYNKTEEAPSLLAVSMYNNLYNRIYDIAVTNTDDDWENDRPLFGDVWLDPELEMEIAAEGPKRMGIHVGDHKDGTPYIMEPDKDSMVKVKMRTKLAIRPYIGFGYGREFVKGKDKFRFAVEVGAIYWGGVPEVTTHDGTDLVNDLRVIYDNQVSRYVDIIKKFPVYPVLNFKISYRLF